MSRLIKRSISLIVMLAFTANTIATTLAITLDEQEDKFFKTQTGSQLHAMFPDKKPDEAVKLAIETVATLHKDKIKGFDFGNQAQEIEKLYNLVCPLLQEEINRGNTHYFLYTGYANENVLYMDILKEFMDQSTLTNDPKTNPFRIKDNPKIKNVHDFLDHFMEEVKKDADAKKGTQVKSMGKIVTHSGSPFDKNRASGFFSAPDAIVYAKEHLLSTNVSLFGNLNPDEVSYGEGECTFLYFLNSFSMATPSDFLIKKLLETMGLADKDAAAFQNQVDLYKSIFSKRLSQAGGGLAQIALKKDEIDELGYASWAKGVPYYMDAKTGHLAIRDNFHSKSIAKLDDKPKGYVRPKLSGMLDLYKRDFTAFSKKYPNYSKKSMVQKAGDRFQVRLFVNPKTFTDRSKVTVTNIFRNEVAPADIAQYKADLRQQLTDDFTKAISQKQLTSKFFKYDFELGKLIKYVFSKSPADHIDDLIQIVRKTSKTVFDATITLVNDAAQKMTNVGKEILKKIDVVKAFQTVKEECVKLGRYVFNGFKQACKKVYKALV